MPHSRACCAVNGRPVSRISLYGFDQFAAAVNVLKHGRGRSYDWLLSMRETLPFFLKGRDQHFFFEGDVSEPDTLVLVDDAFVHYESAAFR